MALAVTQAETSERDAAAAVAALRAQLGPAPLDLVLVFCDAGYDLDALGPALKAGFDCPVIGCTGAGQVGACGFERNAIVVAGLRGGGLQAQPLLIAPLADLQAQTAVAAAAVQAAAADKAGRCFALLLVDGLSTCEEYLAAALYRMIGDVPLLGGSAADDLRFERTRVYHDGRFLADAAVLTLFHSTHPFVVFKLQHFVASDIELVVTEADPARRLIREINGEPAALAYAAAIAVPLPALDPHVFSTHPLVLTLGGEPYVRSILRVNDDLSLTCYCAVEEGMVVSVGKAVDAMETLHQGFAEMRETVPDPALVIGCDCVLRRLEFGQSQLQQEVGAFMARQRVFGFSTFGEQFNGLHVNQTFTGVAIGR